MTHHQTTSTGLNLIQQRKVKASKIQWSINKKRKEVAYRKMDKINQSWKSLVKIKLDNPLLHHITKLSLSKSNNLHLKLPQIYRMFRSKHHISHQHHTKTKLSPQLNLLLITSKEWLIKAEQMLQIRILEILFWERKQLELDFKTVSIKRRIKLLILLPRLVARLINSRR